MKDEIEKRNIDAVKSIANDVISNQEKINHHGKRADTIVKVMLPHSGNGIPYKAVDKIFNHHGKRADTIVKVMLQHNGNGIPYKAVDKIFQPFFTTKPTGQGTDWDYR